MAARGLHGNMEVGEELEMVDMIAAQHAQIAGTQGMQKEGVEGEGEVVKGDGDEKRLDEEHYPSPPPALIVDTGGSADIITEGGSAFSLEEEERKEMEEDVVNVVMAPDDPPLNGGSQLSHRRVTREVSDGGETGGVRFADNPTSSATAGPIIAHPTLSGGSSSGRVSPSSNSSNDDTPPKPRPIDWVTCLSIGVLMNTRGLVALIALNIGLQKGILGPKVFALMVLMALVTTFITSPVFELIFYKPYMAAKRKRREDRRREAELQRRLESGGGSLSKEQEEEEELQRTARHKKEEEEEAKAREEELNRMTILVHQYTSTPRSHVAMFPQTPRNADVQTERPDIRRAHTIGAYALGSRGSVSFKQPQTLHSLYFPNEAAALAAGPPAYARQSSFHLPSSGEPVRSSSHTALDRLGRGGGRDSRSMHNLMQTGPTRMGLFSAGSTKAGVTISEPRAGRTIISSRHPSDYPATHANLMQTGPSRFHHLSSSSSSPSPVNAKPVPPDSAVLERQSSVLQRGPSGLTHTQYVMDDINEREAAEEDAEAEAEADREEEGGREERKRSQTP